MRLGPAALLLALSACAMPTPTPLNGPAAAPAPPGLEEDTAELESAPYELQAVGPLRPTATLADSQSTGFGKERLADGNPDTAWQNGPYRASTGWAGVQLSAIHSLASLRLKTGPTGGARFDVQVSDDGNTWRTVLAGQAVTTWNTESRNLPAGTSGRYVRLFFRNGTTNPLGHFQVFELSVSGEGTGSVTPAPVPSGSGGPTGTGARYYPDLAAMPPDNLSVSNGQLRFSNAIPNYGAGPFQVRSVVDGTTTRATQEILDASGRIVERRYVGNFVYHPQHNHTHLEQVARYELRRGSAGGTVVVAGTKISFCMLDSFPVRSGAPSATYRECNPTIQGISRAWADLYASNLPDQNLPVRGLAAGEYYLVTTTDPTAKFIDTNRGNNRAWVKIYLNPATNQVRRLGTSN